MESAAHRPAIRPRDPGLKFEEDIPRYWFNGSPLATHLANGVGLLFPAGERFFVRSVRHYLDRIDDPELREAVRGFFGQEGRHARAHEAFFARLEAQGYDVRGFLRIYERIGYGMIEPAAPRALRLAVTVALEHYTAVMAENALRERLLDAAHPALRDLLLWHASEEIEHKSVAFDVLSAVEPGYGLRMAGLALGTLCLAGFWMAATLSLLEQDRRRGDLKLFAEIGKMSEHPIARTVFLKGMLSYLRRDFHPSQIDNGHLAQEYLEEKGMT